MIPLYSILKFNFPTATFGIEGNVQLSDYGDGNGAVISYWNVPNTTQPTNEQLIAWQTDTATIQAYIFQQNAVANIAIQKQLDDIDSQSVRALREPSAQSTAKLATLTSQASALRAQLLPTS